VKTIVLISSFCDNQLKIDVLYKNIQKYNDLGFDTLLISPFSLPDYVVNGVSYFIKTKDNVVFKWPLRAILSWLDKNIDGIWYRFNSCQSDYGFAGLYQVKQMSQIAILLGYEKFIHTIYDTILTDEIIQEFYKDHECTVFPSKRKNHVWTAGLHLHIFNKENMSKLIEAITTESYLNYKDVDVFQWLEKQVNDLNFNIGEIPVEDEIVYKTTSSIFDTSNFTEYSLFILNNVEFNNPIKIFIYNIKDINLLTVIINSHEIINITQNGVIELNKTIDQLKSVKIVYGDHIQEIIDDIKNVTYNSIDKL
jgi:hypothetical protein